MEIQIQNSRHTDLNAIFALYDDAIAYQKKVGNNHWLGFEQTLVAKEIDEQRHYVIVAEGQIVGTFCITLSDPLIWKDADHTAAIYIHRIATSQAFRGHNFVKHIINWGLEFAKTNSLKYIRMDTGSGNDRLINYYISCGFTFIGDTTVNYTTDLLAHYKDGSFALFEMPV